MKIDVLTLFPETFNGFLKESIIGKAIENSIVDINLIDFREFSTNKHKKVDDYPYGGGAGMVLCVEPVILALRSISGYEQALKIIMSPQGTTYNQNKAYELSEHKHIIILCGHYEGFDERIRNYFDIEVSLGDFVLTGGEVAAMAIIDSVVRLKKGAISKEESHLNDSFSDGLLEHPQYTRPREFEGETVPEVLLNGHHKLIDEWRLSKSLEKTKRIRPDLYKKYIEKVK